MKLLAITLLAGCWSVPAAVPASGAVPGQLWTTQAQPWRMMHGPTALGIDGTSAIVGGDRGWLARMDLTTGAIVRERRIDRGLTFYDMSRMADGRWVVVGTQDGSTRAFVVDRELVATPITLGVAPDRSYIHAGVAVMANGDVVIAGTGLPLAIYDPKTWKIKSILAAELGWNRPRILGSTLGVTLASTAFRFDLATGERTEIGPASTVQATAQIVALRVYDDDKWFAEIWQDGKKVSRIAHPIGAIALDADGKRLVVSTATAVEVYALPELETPIATISFAGASQIVGLTIEGDRAVVSTGWTLRVVDLAKHTVTPIESMPWGAPEQMTVDDTGTVMALEPNHAWWLANGKLVHDAPLTKSGINVLDGDTTLYGERSDRDITILDMTRQRQRWTLPEDALGTWIGSADSAISEMMFTVDEPSKIMTLQAGGAMETSIEFTSDGDLRDIDPGQDVVIGAGGLLYVVPLSEPQTHITLRAPNCAEWASVDLEHAAERAAVFDGKQVALWNRRTGRLLGAMEFPDSVRSVMFVPDGEIIVEFVDGLAFVDLATKRMRVLELPEFRMAEISATGKRMAIAYGNGRIVLVDVAAMRATLTDERPIRSIEMPRGCKGPDPFAIQPKHRDYDDDFEF